MLYFFTSSAECSNDVTGKSEAKRDGFKETRYQNEVREESKSDSKFLRKRTSPARLKNNDSMTILSEHERKLLAGARIIASFVSTRGYEMVRGCASEIIRENVPNKCYAGYTERSGEAQEEIDD